jgi:hypothetical protein
MLDMSCARWCSKGEIINKSDESIMHDIFIQMDLNANADAPSTGFHNIYFVLRFNFKPDIDGGIKNSYDVYK